MPTLSNERLCKLAQAGDTAARDILLENNLGFIRKIALEQYRSMGLCRTRHQISDLCGTSNPQRHDRLHPRRPRFI